jgi:hypothetical protein
VVKSSNDLRISFLRQEFVDELVLSRTLKEELMRSVWLHCLRFGVWYFGFGA